MSVHTESPQLVVPALIRGNQEVTDLVSFGGRGGEVEFSTPDPCALAQTLPLRDPCQLEDVAQLPFTEIVDYLAHLGQHLSLSSNGHLQQVLHHSAGWSDMTASLVRSSLKQLPTLFTPDAVRELADVSIGIPYLEGWVGRRMADGRMARIRAMGARTVHVIAGNSPLIAGLSIIRNAVARSDAVIKSPSNDPLTALAIARTMVDIAPDHPITRHLSVVYWPGGDEKVEAALYRPANIEKIIAWGGFASVTHVLRYLQPGLELITLDPKRSATIIGPEAFESEQMLDEVALRLATDIGAMNQLGCVNARVVYVLGGQTEASLSRLNELGDRVYRHLVALPDFVSTVPKRFDPELRANLDAVRTSPDFYRVVGGRDDEGAVVVSQLDEPVDFHRALSGRVANLVPVDDTDDILHRIDSYTQTIGIYPDALKDALRDRLGLYGAQRVVSLGYAAHPNVALPQDAIEPMRRMVRWIVDEDCKTDEVNPLWLEGTR